MTAEFPWETPDLLADWDIPVEGEVYASEEVRLETINDGDIVRSVVGFMWVHLTRAGINVQRGFPTLEAAAVAARERAHVFGAIFVPSNEETDCDA
jgi:hypothetical protein